MLRYIAVAWNSDAPEQCHTISLVRERIRRSSARWLPAVDIPGLYVAYVTDPRCAHSVLVLPESSGVIMGQVFDLDCTKKSVSREATARLLATNGRSIISECWGSYVLFLNDRRSQRRLVVRAPMGTLPCFYTKLSDASIVFSSIDDLTEFRVMSLSINWDCIRAQAINRDYLTQETGFREISSLECGECLDVDSTDFVVRSYWNPCAIARTPEICNFEHAASAFRTETVRSVSAWASVHDRIVHLLSGGLDSSIVAACLKDSPSKLGVTCVNLYSRQRIGDERRFARSMAERTGLRLIEIEENPNLDLHCFLNCSMTARPSLTYIGCDPNPPYLQLARDLYATAVFDGELGDNVFGAIPGHEVVTEHIWRHGFGAAALGAAYDYAYLKRLSVWVVLYRALRDQARIANTPYWSMHNYMKHIADKDPRNTGLISSAAVEEYESQMPRFIHPFFLDIQGVPVGRFALIWGIVVRTSTSYHPPFMRSNDPDAVSPLASQRLVECALRTASPLHMSGGRDRSVIRHAFESDLSQSVLARRGKGTPDGWLLDVIKRNRSFLRETLLDGLLVRERILDKAKVEAILDGSVTNTRQSLMEVIIQLFIEVWLRRWEAADVRAAP